MALHTCIAYIMRTKLTAFPCSWLEYLHQHCMSPLCRCFFCFFLHAGEAMLVLKVLLIIEL